jgi:hypothetical protein
LSFFKNSLKTTFFSGNHCTLIDEGRVLWDRMAVEWMEIQESVNPFSIQETA